jgi:hypothetical protein
MSAHHILLVEDNPDDVELTRLAFAEAGGAHRLHAVGDGAEALDYLLARGRHADRDGADLPALVLWRRRRPARRAKAIGLASYIRRSLPGLSGSLVPGVHEDAAAGEDAVHVGHHAGHPAHVEVLAARAFLAGRQVVDVAPAPAAPSGACWTC